MKILRRCILLMLFLFVAGLGPARAQSFAWARLIRGAIDTAFVQSESSTTDAAGNTYLALLYKDSLRVSGVLFTGPRYLSRAIIKLDSTGSIVWAKNLVFTYSVKLAADNSSGGIFMGGSVYGNGVPTWGGVALPLNPGGAFYAKCSATGTMLWANSLPAISSFGNRAVDVVADDGGNAYFTGTVGSSSTVGTVPVASSENYFFKTTGAGTIQWTRVLHTNATSPLYITFGPKPGGGFLVAGNITNTPLYLGSGTATPVLPGRQLTDGFLTSFDGTGAHQWSQVVGIPSSTIQGFANSYALVADASGNCYATGGITGTLQLGGATLANSFFLVKYDAGGVLQWVQGAQNANYSAGYRLVVDNTGPTAVVNAYPSTPIATVGALKLQTFSNIVHFTPQGLAQWTTGDATALPTPSSSSFYYSHNGLGIDARGNLYTVGQPNSTANRIPVTQLGSQTAVGNGTIVSRLNAYANTLRGQVYLDQNGNGQQDASEGAFPRQLAGALTQGTTTFYQNTYTDGSLQVYANPGPYSLTLASVPAHYAFTQPVGGVYAGSFAGNSQLVTGQNFGLAPIANQTDLRLTLTPYGFPRAGFTLRYRLTLENTGTTTLPAGVATLTLDALTQYISSTPSGTAAGRVITWSYGSLAPFGQLTYDVLVSLPTNAPLGAALSTSAAAPVPGDVVPSDNTTTLAQTVVGPFDPNSIEVNYERLTPAQVAAQQYLDYTIHFQNLGTAPASTVILSDTLDFRKLDLKTLMLVAQSHNCIWSLSSNGPNTGLLTVRFLNINLPERNADVIRSQGFVRFRVQPRSTLAVGNVIPNRANIFFDFNAPVSTNTATTTVMLASAALARHDAPAWEAYPNPAANVVSVAADLASAGQVRLELLDAVGRTVRQQMLTAPAGALRQSLDLSGLAPGLYVLRLTPPTGPASSRQLVRQ